MSQEGFQQGSPQPVEPAFVGPSVALTSDDKTWGMLAHLLSLAGYIGIPFGNVIAPLVVWLVKRDTSKFVDYHGKESLNFQINILVYLLVSIPLLFCIVGIFTMAAAYVYGVVMAIVAAIKANNQGKQRRDVPVPVHVPTYQVE
jgi:uncharacterized Tic20 family protein